MTDKKASEETLAANVADADFWAGVKSGLDVRFSFAQVKTWIKSWLAKGDVGLGNVDNTADVSKPISTATQTALNLKANTSSLGTAAAANTADFATASQGGLADTAVQPGSLGALATKNKADVPGDLNVTGTPDGSKFLRDDGSWQGIPGGGDMLAANNLSDVTDKGLARNNLGIIPALKSALINGAMDVWQRGTSVGCSAGVRTFLADRWFVNPAGAAVTASRASSVLPIGARSRYALQMVGATSVTTVNVGQRIEAANIPQIKGMVVFQAQVYNGTGANFTPSLLLGTPAAADDFTTVTNRLTQVMQSVVSGAGYTQVSFSVDISGYTNIDNGLQVEIQIPSGALDSGAKDVKITEVSLQLGTKPTVFERPPLSVTYNLCLPYYQKSFPYGTVPAQAANTSGALVTVTATTTAGSGAESVRFLPPMRSTPSVTTYTPNVAGGGWLDSAAGAQRTNATSDVCDKGMRLTVNQTTTAAAQHFIHWSANAEL